MVKALFSLAHKFAPSVVFIDEIDSVLTARRENESDSTRRLKTEFLVQVRPRRSKRCKDIFYLILFFFNTFFSFFFLSPSIFLVLCSFYPVPLLTRNRPRLSFPLLSPFFLSPFSFLPLIHFSVGGWSYLWSEIGSSEFI